MNHPNTLPRIERPKKNGLVNQSNGCNRRYLIISGMWSVAVDVMGIINDSMDILSFLCIWWGGRTIPEGVAKDLILQVKLPFGNYFIPIISRRSIVNIIEEF